MEEKFECRICMENVLLDQCFKTQPSRACFNSFCTYCVAKYIEFEISKNTASIRCPLQEACKDHMLNPFKCKKLISKELFDRWCDVLCESTIRGLERCHCPNRACLELIVEECSTVVDVQNRKISCPNCKKSCCFGCSSPWQEGHQCSNHLPPGNNWQRCPGCRNYVERNGGCCKIRCRCGVTFCYNCGSRCEFIHTCPRSIPCIALQLFPYIVLFCLFLIILGLNPWFSLFIASLEYLVGVCIGYLVSVYIV